MLRARIAEIFLLLCALAPLALQAAVAPAQIAVVYKRNDADSRALAEYYAKKRGLPAKNILAVSLPDSDSVSAERFRFVRKLLWRQTPETVQFYALAFSRPYRVGCMSMTSAMAFGFNESWCASGCKPTRESPYYNADTHAPFTDFGIRPAMMLAGRNLQQARALVDRGIEADGSRPAGTAYLLDTSDRARNVRARRYPAILRALGKRLKIEIIDGDVLHDRDDVLFYFTGKARVRGIDSNHYLPGAIADHLTSFGGRLFGWRQTSILEWLQAGVTGSYGTVVEPCAFSQKFPNPGIVIDRYTRGESLIEAYWKSVAWPGQGLFVGEPLAAPFAKK